MVYFYSRGQREKPAKIEKSARCLMVEIENRMHTSRKCSFLESISCVALDCTHKK